MKCVKDLLKVNIGVDIAKNVACRTPGLASAMRRAKLREGYNPGTNAVSYPLGVFRAHAAQAIGLRGRDLAGADVLEIGPGGNVGVTLLMGLAGARSLACIDNIPWARIDALRPLYSALIAAAAHQPDVYFVAPDLRQRALADPDGLAGELLARLTYRAPDDISTTALPSASLDLIYSHACFEHFADPAGSIRQIARLLRAGGVTTHQIDLRDHRDFSRPLGHLRYPESLWRLANSHRPHGVRNRWRASEYRDCFAANGLEVISLDPTQTVAVSDEMRQRFHPRFYPMTLDDLSMVSVFVVARKGEARP